ncbi:carboxymuconolactone decarboxylase family protein [Sphingomonas oryzagri]|uniref:Carboxymuconolactone decarboxylase family protein n=1 Tax=Sphingomonas oryzagri TaxID=3042314 RepID=A0ABT6N773_9SPHN|nr:carboxymuconolactone decarboxylase family protein [Sphingomonas oryzagri]MDH7640957.1 carboxymuconolactone decarboxylase family protein [Sphingomonas oryzagri]
MRLPLIAPADLTEEQKPLYADMKKGISSDFNAFITVAPEGTTEAGALMGPWNPWLHEPRIGGAIWELTKAMTMEATLPDDVRQIAILVTGAHFDAAYEIYAHIAVAEVDKIDDATLATLVSGSRPDGLSREQGIGYDVAFALVNGGVLPEPVYRIAVSTFGQHGANELIYLVGLYALVSMTLNGFNVPLPEKD